MVKGTYLLNCVHLKKKNIQASQQIAEFRHARLQISRTKIPNPKNIKVTRYTLRPN